MDINYLEGFKFNKEPYEGCSIKCAECGNSNNYTEWKEIELGCEECRTHDGLECPICGECYDYVWGPILEVI